MQPAVFDTELTEDANYIRAQPKVQRLAETDQPADSKDQIQSDCGDRKYDDAAK